MAPKLVASNEEIIRSIYDAAEDHDIDRAMTLYHDEIRVAMSGLEVHGKADFAGFLQAWLTAFPDIKWTITNSVTSGDTTVAEITARGTHTGTLHMPEGDIPATGASFTTLFCEVHRFRDGLLAETRMYWDSVTLLRQLGVIPSSDGA